MAEEDYEGFFDIGDDLEEEMQRDYLQHLLDEEEPQPEEEDFTSGVSGNGGAVLDALNKPPPSSSSSTANVGTVAVAVAGAGKPSYKFSYERARIPTPAEFALELRKARANMLKSTGTDALVTHAMLNVTDMVTLSENAVARVDGGEFLHKFCDESSASHVPCILANGSRFYLRKRQTVSDNKASIVSRGSKALTTTGVGGAGEECRGQLLSRSMFELQREADRIQTEALADRKLREEAIREAELYGTNLPSNENLGIESALQNETDSKGEKTLWVEKYAPKSFSQLLSEEKLNREVLGALRAWSPYVFKSGGPEKVSAAVGLTSSVGTLGGAGIRSSGPKEQPSATKSTKKQGGMENDNDNDEGGDDDNDGVDNSGHHAHKNDNRPFFKALLICGPPGTGKTTLAHVVAKHCGYRPFEVNASDDRSHDVLKDSLMRAMHGNTVIGERQPNCIILDEIDGIDGKNTIDMLVKMIRAPLRVKGHGGGAKGKAGSSSNTTPITRPLICICNDQYAPSLRELRKFSRVFVFHPPTELRLVARLKAICAFEKMSNVSPQSLTALASATGNDIRSAINTLQFAAIRTSTLKMSDAAARGLAVAAPGPSSFGRMLSSMINSGLKDVNRDAFQVWREIFSIREMSLAAAKKKNVFSSNNKLVPAGAQAGLIGATAQDSTAAANQKQGRSSTAGPEAAMIAMSDFGDSHLIVSGIFHNLLSIRYNDPSMTRTHLASDWLSAVDQFDCFASGAGGNSGSGGGNSDSIGYQLMPYISSVAGAMHLLCAADEKVKISWPSREKDAYYKHKSKNNILETLLGSAKLGSFCMRSKTPVITDVLSFLIDITTPKARPVSLLTLTQTEQEALDDCVKVMASAGLSYTSANPSAGLEGSFYIGANIFTLEPAITELLSFSQCDELKNRHSSLPTEIKSILNVELKKFVISSRIRSEEEGSKASKHTPATKRSNDNSYRGGGDSESKKRSSPIDVLQSPNSAKKANTDSSADSSASANKNHRSIQVASEDDIQSKRMKLGRMDMFCKKENKSNNFVKPSSGANGISKVTQEAAADLELAIKLKREGSNIRYKFNAGYSNAVRRSVPISDFL